MRIEGIGEVFVCGMEPDLIPFPGTFAFAPCSVSNPTVLTSPPGCSFARHGKLSPVGRVEVFA